jgi:D-xylulose reductase
MSTTVVNGSKKTNMCAVCVGPKLLEVQERPFPEDPLGPDEVLIQVIATGICGSDCHSWEVGTTKPLTLGHESSGVIIEIGSAVADNTVGQRVAIEPREACLK